MITLGAIAAGFISPVLHAWSTVFDHKFTKELPGETLFIITVSKVFQMLLCPLLIVFVGAWHLPTAAIPLILAVAVIEVVYVYPYLMAYKHTDTSIVVALFALGRILVPLMAYGVLGETVTLPQVVGFIIIVGASMMITFDPHHLRFNAAALWMLLSSLLLSVEAIITKYVFLQYPDIDWALFSLVTITAESLITLFAVSWAWRRMWRLWQSTPPGLKRLFVTESVCGWFGNVGSFMAVDLLPVTVAKAISSTQPMFVVGYQQTLGHWLPTLFNESDSGISASRKWLAFVLILLGTVLVTLAG